MAQVDYDPTTALRNALKNFVQAAQDEVVADTHRAIGDALRKACPDWGEVLSGGHLEDQTAAHLALIARLGAQKEVVTNQAKIISATLDALKACGREVAVDDVGRTADEVADVIARNINALATAAAAEEASGNRSFQWAIECGRARGKQAKAELHLKAALQRLRNLYQVLETARVGAANVEGPGDPEQAAQRLATYVEELRAERTRCGAALKEESDAYSTTLRRALAAEARVAELEHLPDPQGAQKALVRVANALGITSPMQLMQRAVNNEQTYTDLLLEVLEEKLAGAPSGTCVIKDGKTTHSYGPVYGITQAACEEYALSAAQHNGGTAHQLLLGAPLTPNADGAVKHVCGARGYGLKHGDVCEACELEKNADGAQ